MQPGGARNDSRVQGATISYKIKQTGMTLNEQTPSISLRNAVLRPETAALRHLFVTYAAWHRI